MADIITSTIGDKEFLSFLLNKPFEVRKIYMVLRDLDEKSKGKRHNFRLLREVRQAARNGVVTKYPGTDRDIQKLVLLQVFELVGDVVNIYGARETSEDLKLYKLTDLGLDVARQTLAIDERDRGDKNALTELGAKGRRAMRKIMDTLELPTAPGMLEDLFYAGMLERKGRGGKPLSARRAKQLRGEPLDRDKLRPTERYRRTVERISKTGSYLS